MLSAAQARKLVRLLVQVIGARDRKEASLAYYKNKHCVEAVIRQPAPVESPTGPDSCELLQMVCGGDAGERRGIDPAVHCYLTARSLPS